MGWGGLGKANSVRGYVATITTTTAAVTATATLLERNDLAAAGGAALEALATGFRLAGFDSGAGVGCTL